MPRRARGRRIQLRIDGELALDAGRARERRVQRGIDGRVAVDENLKERILRAYGSPGHPIAFSGVDTVANFYKMAKKEQKKSYVKTMQMFYTKNLKNQPSITHTKYISVVN